MSTSILVHDSKATGHPGWLRAQLGAGRIQGAMFDAFHSPAEARPGQWPVSRSVAELGGEFPHTEMLFDPCTHGALAPGAGDWTNYDSWGLWPHGRGRLETPSQRRDHVEAVLAVQHDLGVPTVAPTVALERFDGPEADLALQLAEEARRQDPTVIQTLVARRSGWAGGRGLDDHVGALAVLRARRWLITPMRDNLEFPADPSDLEATAGFARTVHSLAGRAQVTIGHGADGFAIPALAAGASGLGTGWYSKQRICAPGLYAAPGAGGGQHIVWCPHPGLLARLRRPVAEALADAAPALARRLRFDRDLPVNDAEYRDQHLETVRELLEVLDHAGDVPAARVPVARTMLEQADAAWGEAVAEGVADVTNKERRRWVSVLAEGFELYAGREGL